MTSLPRDLLDQLITGYLDGALSSDELARVETLIEQDHEFAASVKEYQEIRECLRISGQIALGGNLPVDFATRVLDESVSRARDEGLGDDHPLIRLAEQPAAPIASARSGTWPFEWKAASLLVGIAASIGLATFAFWPQREPGVALQNLVDANELGKQRTVEGFTPLDSADTDLALAPTATKEPAQNLPVEDLVPRPDTNDPRAANLVLQDRPRENPEMPVTPLDGVSQSARDFGANEPPEASVAMEETIVPSDVDTSPVSDESDLPVDATKDRVASRGIPIIVFSVRLTDLGRTNNAIGQALQVAGLENAARKDVTGEVADFAKNQIDEDAESARVLFLQGGAKSIDRFYLHLISLPESVESVGMTLATNAPVQRLLGSVKPKPTDVRHDNLTFELTAVDGVGGLAAELGGMIYLPVTGGVGNINSSGEDFASQALVLIR